MKKYSIYHPNELGKNKVNKIRFWRKASSIFLTLNLLFYSFLPSAVILAEEAQVSASEEEIVSEESAEESAGEGGDTEEQAQAEEDAS